jgi:hypothetical protein
MTVTIHCEPLRIFQVLHSAANADIRSGDYDALNEKSRALNPDSSRVRDVICKYYDTFDVLDDEENFSRAILYIRKGDAETTAGASTS